MRRREKVAEETGRERNERGRSGFNTQVSADWRKMEWVRGRRTEPREREKGRDI